MTSEPYAKAIVALIQENADFDVLLEGLDRVLSKRGHLRLKTLILRRVLVLLEHSQKTAGPTLRVARQGDVDQHKAAIEAACAQLQVSSEPRVKEDSTLIGGFKLETKEKRYDYSYKRVLHRLYQRIIGKPETTL